METNNSELSSQQEELKKRLEEIRNRRKAEDSPRRNASNQTPRRNEGTQKNPTSKKTQASASPTPSLQTERVKKEASSSKPIKRRTYNEPKKIKNKKKNELVKQLTNADSLKNAMIL